MGYLSPPTGIRYHQVTLFTKAKTDEYRFIKLSNLYSLCSLKNHINTTLSGISPCTNSNLNYKRLMKYISTLGRYITWTTKRYPIRKCISIRHWYAQLFAKFEYILSNAFEQIHLTSTQMKDPYHIVLQRKIKNSKQSKWQIELLDVLARFCTQINYKTVNTKSATRCTNAPTM